MRVDWERERRTFAVESEAVARRWEDGRVEGSSAGLS